MYCIENEITILVTDGLGFHITRRLILTYLYIAAGCVRGVVGEGMPIYKNPFEKGDLYIRIEVDFPENYFANEGKLKVSVCPSFSSYLVS